MVSLWLQGSGNDRKVRVWESTTGKENDPLGKHPEFVWGVAFSPDGKVLAASGRTTHAQGVSPERVRIWNVTSGKEKYAFQFEPAKQTGSALPVLAFNPKDGNMLAVAGRGGLVHFWDIAAVKETKALAGPVDFLTSIAFSPNGKLVAAAGRRSVAGRAEVILWEPATGKEVARHDGPNEVLINSVVFTPDSKQLVAGCSNGEVHIWDVERGWQRIIPGNLSEGVQFVAISSVPLPDGIGPKKEKMSRWLLAAADRTKQVRILAIPSGEEIAVLKGHDSAVMCVAFSPDGKHLVSGGWDSTVRLWRVPKMQAKAAGEDSPDQKIPVHLEGLQPDPKPAKPAEPLKINLDIPKKEPTVGEVNNGSFTFALIFENTGKQPLVLYPYVSPRLCDAAGKEVKRSAYLGRYGDRSKDSIIEETSFFTLKPGETKRCSMSVAAFEYDPKAIRGWLIPEPGNYRLEMHYHYNRAAARKEFGDGCKDLDNPNQPWNQAVEIDRKFEVKIRATK